MQVKTIEKKIRLKLEAWLESITDTKLREDVKNSLLVSGGSITSLFFNEDVNDYDVYIQKIDVAERLALYYTKDIPDITVWNGSRKHRIKSSEGDGTLFINDIIGDGIDYSKEVVAYRTLKDNQIKLYMYDTEGYKVDMIESGAAAEAPKPYRVSFISPNAISLTDDIQIVFRFTGEPKQIHKTFDFVHATNYFTFDAGLVTNIEALESILTKQLRYQGSQYPLTSVIRTKKFLKRGWNITAGEYLKMLFQTSELDLTNPDVLEEQLIGVDVAYFGRLIQILRTHSEKHPEFKLSSGYLAELVDRVFNQDDTEDGL